VNTDINVYITIKREADGRYGTHFNLGSEKGPRVFYFNSAAPPTKEVINTILEGIGEQYVKLNHYFEYYRN
jgi:hypothetical protein